MKIIYSEIKFQTFRVVLDDENSNLHERSYKKRCNQPSLTGFIHSLIKSCFVFTK